jgi:DASH complex subunit DAD2
MHICLRLFTQPLQQYSPTGTTCFVLSTWHPVSCSLHGLVALHHLTGIAILPKPKDEEEAEAETKPKSEPPLPQTLVRIPTQHAPAVIEQANAGVVAE